MRILIVDDDPLTLEPLMLRLGEHDVVGCLDGEAAWEAIEAGPDPDIVILDWMLPGIDGLELCRRIRERKDGPYLYIIMLTGRTGPEDLLAGFEAGADDYLAKPYDGDELDARLRAGERIVDLQNALIDAREKLRKQAMQDPLTGVLNHGAILDTLRRELNRAAREAQPLSVILADLDDFKRVTSTSTRSPAAFAAVSDRTMRSGATGVRSSSSCCRTAGRRRRRVSPGGSGPWFPTPRSTPRR